MFCVTFYSFKGGVGRTMALINTAILLAEANKRVLVVDFDLEAPGITSYKSFRGVSCEVGLVDAVERYSASGKADNISEYIQRTKLGNKDIWVLPAGNHDAPKYGSQFSGIDWNILYREKHGFLFFEDVRQQWEQFEGKGFDYVLIDSRTGYTDVAGICTRQLPDLVVNLFVPTDQNIRGLAPILSEMIDNSSPKIRRVDHIVCASNVPDVDDEDGIIEKQLSLARDLFPSQIAEKQAEIPVLNHYSSIDMLSQCEFVLDRPRSRLAIQYRDLYKAIIRYNVSDREGALARLNEVVNFLDEARPRGKRRVIDLDDDDLSALVSNIRALHESDGEVAFLCARVARHLGEIDTEIAALTVSITQGYAVTPSRLNRSYAHVVMGSLDLAAADLLEVIFSAHSLPMDIRAALSRLRAIKSEDWLSEILARIGAISGRQDLLEVLASEATRSRSSAQEFDRFLDRSCEREGIALSSIGISKNSLALLKVCALMPEAALSVLAGDNDLRLQEKFNRAIANWMITAKPDIPSFIKIFGSMEDMVEKGANAHQCYMLVASLVEPDLEKRRLIASTVKRLPVSGTHFNCDTFLLSPASIMAEAMLVYRSRLLDGEVIVPEIVQEFLDSKRDSYPKI